MRRSTCCAPHHGPDPDRIVAIGYGIGGAIALELGRDGVELRAIGMVNGLITVDPRIAAEPGRSQHGKIKAAIVNNWTSGQPVGSAVSPRLRWAGIVPRSSGLASGHPRPFDRVDIGPRCEADQTAGYDPDHASPSVHRPRGPGT
jgi:hypothetical protein